MIGKLKKRKYNFIILAFTICFLNASAIAQTEDKTPLELYREGRNSLSAAKNFKGEIDMQKLDSAIKTLDKCLEISPCSYNCTYTRGLAYLLKKDLNTAISDFEKSYEIYSDTGAPQYELAKIYQNKKDYDKAFKYYELATFSQIGKNLSFLSDQVRFYLKIGKKSEAETILSFNNPYFRDISSDSKIEELAQLNSLAGNYQESLNYLEKISERLRINNPEYYFDKSVALYNLKQYERALIETNRAIGIEEELRANRENNTNEDIKYYQNRMGKYFYSRGVLHRNLGKFKEALADYTKAIEFSPNHSDAYNNRGLIYIATNEPDLAKKDFDSAINADPKNQRPLINRANYYLGSNNLEAAFKDLLNAEKLSSGNPYLSSLKGNYFLRTNNNEEAVKAFSAAIEIDKTSPSLFNDRGVAYARMENIDKAFADFDQAIKLSPDNGLYYANRSLIYCRKNNIRLAQFDEQKANDLGYNFTLNCETTFRFRVTKPNYSDA